MARLKKSWLSSRHKPGTDSTSTSTSTSTSKKTFPKGIELWYCPEGDSIVDIVFIHGLTGDREKTWTAKDALEPWPKTLLPSKIPNARILTFGYDAYVADWRGVVSQNRISNHAWDLLTSLGSHRDEDGTNNRPIIFVVHSLGGLVCENALVIARQRPEPHLSNIMSSTHGILFLGTPHHGSALAQWAEMLSRHIGVVKRMNSKILEVLKQDSEVLAIIQDGFHTLVKARSKDRLPPIEISCFYEELPLVGVGFVVPKDSAILPGNIPIGIRSDHMGMSKFTGTDDPGFISVSRELRRWMKEVGSTYDDCKDALQGADKHDGLAAQFIVPYPINRRFIERSEVFERLKYQLYQPHVRVALYGLGGTGKTQIALAFTHWLHRASPNISIFWVHASNAERFREAYTSIAKTCQVPKYDDPNTDTVALLKSWLEEKDRGRWLMIIDNADDAQLFCRPEAPARNPVTGEGNSGPYFAQYIPECAHGTVLITTRNKKVGSHLCRGAPLIQVDNMTDGESRQLLQKQLDDTHTSADELLALANRLEHLPLALAQAAAYMQANSMSITRYLELLDQNDGNPINLLSEEFEATGRDSALPHGVVATWILSFDQIERQNALAGEILSLMSLLDRQAIPMEFLSCYNEKWSTHPDTDPVRLENALGVLKAYSLITQGNDGNLDMHRLVHFVTRKWLAETQKAQDFTGRALLVLSECYPYYHDSKTLKFREKCIAYLPHALAVLESGETRSKDEALARAKILHRVANFHMVGGQVSHAEKFLVQAVDTRKKELGAEHPDTLNSMADLIWTYYQLSRWKDAESLGVQVTQTSRRVLGAEHPNTLYSMANLVTVYRSQGRFKEAEVLGVQLMELNTRIQGAEHSITLYAMAEMAEVYYQLSRWKEAESLGVQVMETSKRVLGAEHPNTLYSMGTLAGVYRSQGRFKEAEVLGVQTMETRLRVLGPEHPNTLFAMYSLALTRKSQGRTDDAIHLMETVPEGLSRVLGDEHPDAVKSLSLLNKWREERRKGIV
ncbi:hypothetical protein F4778DRAFT_771119 [Xylariomycetidae sp. FL2044]|nr:hypothetical protein F4778DRAFT_771119 [Xylariomycetidae sp. FL2044]